MHAVVVLRDTGEAVADGEGDAALAERALESLRQRLVLGGHEVGEALDDRDVRTERLPDGGELDADGRRPPRTTTDFRT